MNERNIAIVNKAVEEYKEKAYRQIIKIGKDISLQLLKDAVFWRRHNNSAHDFTGNFINAIRVVLIVNAELAKYTRKEKWIFSPDKDMGNVPQEMMDMMSSERGGSYQRRRRQYTYEDKVKQTSEYTSRGLYRFNRDYSWATHTHYEATVATENTRAPYLADAFVKRLLMEDNSNIFEIHVVYGAPYAEYIEGRRRTTGIDLTYTSAIDEMSSIFKRV